MFFIANPIHFSILAQFVRSYISSYISQEYLVNYTCHGLGWFSSTFVYECASLLLDCIFVFDYFGINHNGISLSSVLLSKAMHNFQILLVISICSSTSHNLYKLLIHVVWSFWQNHILLSSVLCCLCISTITIKCVSLIFYLFFAG